MAVDIRVATPSDAEACGRIIYEVFKEVADRHGLPPDFPAVEAGIQFAHAFVAHPSIFGVVAEDDGRVVGSNFLTEGDAIRAVGPITVDPRAQRHLMAAVLERGRDAPASACFRAPSICDPCRSTRRSASRCGSRFW